jgi:hypothetical protein
VRNSDPYPPVGSSVTATATVGNPGPRPLLRTSVALLAPAGWTASKPVTLGAVPPGGTATASFTVTPAAALPPGSFDFTAVASFTPAGAPGQKTLVGGTGAETPYGSLAAAFGNTGISADSDTGAADLDGSGYSFSATALADAGVTPGSTVTAGGMSFTWPNVAAGSADNVAGSGQEISVSGTGRDLGLLDTASYGPAQGTGTIVYADGTTQSFTLDTPDWYAGPPQGSAAAVTTAYRNAPGNTQDDHPVYVYEQSVPLDSTAQVTAVVLPKVSQGVTAGSAALHVFALAIGG